MRLAISNIAWEPADDAAIASLLNAVGVDAIDVAHSKYFPDPAVATDQDIDRVKAWWSARSIGITGMQALLFGTSGLNVFGPPDVQDAMLRHLDAVCRIGAGLGATRLVFGSPKNRDRSALSDAQASDVAMDFFGRLGDIARARGVLICLEPNPVAYGANFMTNSAQTAQVVRLLDHPAIRMQFDTGALAMNGEDPDSVLADSAKLIGHVHASEPNLLPLGDGETDHARMHAALARYSPEQVVTIEMLATKTESHLLSVERALHVALRHYRPEQCA